MRTNTPNDVSPIRQESPSSPLCVRCASAATEPAVTMRRHTVDAAPWYHCEECGHVFAVRDDQ